MKRTVPPQPNPGFTVHCDYNGKCAGFSLPMQKSSTNAFGIRQFLNQKRIRNVTNIICMVAGRGYRLDIVIICNRFIDESLKTVIEDAVRDVAQQFLGIHDVVFTHESRPAPRLRITASQASGYPEHAWDDFTDAVRNLKPLETRFLPFRFKDGTSMLDVLNLVTAVADMLRSEHPYVTLDSEPDEANGQVTISIGIFNPHFDAEDWADIQTLIEDLAAAAFVRIQ